MNECLEVCMLHQCVLILRYLKMWSDGTLCDPVCSKLPNYQCGGGSVTVSCYCSITTAMLCTVILFR